MNMGRTRTLTAAIVCGLIGSAAMAQPAGAVQFNPNPWRGFGFLNIAHQGGEDEAPSNTMFAFKSAMQDRGADMLELDVNLTLDNELLVIHNDTVNSTTEEARNRASGFSEVNDLNLSEIRALDNAYSFETGGAYNDDAGDDTHPYRGIGCTTCTRPAPAGYVKEDFVHPTLEQVLDAFPDTPINIEIKMIKTTASAVGGCQTQGMNTYCDDATGSIPVAEKLAEILNRDEYDDRTDILVVSFSDLLVDHFNGLAPHVAIAPGTTGVVTGLVGGTPNPDVSAFQIPPRNSGFTDLPERMMCTSAPPTCGNAHGRGYAVHIFTENRSLDENDAGYSRFVNLGVEGVMSSLPARLHEYLCRTGVRRPDGSARCPAQDAVAPSPPAATPPATTKKCKKAKKKGGAKGKKSAKGKCGKKKKKKAKK